jgi:hypothetical protein
MRRDGRVAAGEGVEQRRLSGVGKPDDAQALHAGQGNGLLASLASMSKRTAKRKARSRRKKANHGKRPNVGRR